MSTLAKTYSLACGVKLDKPWINDSFYPLGTPLEKVILFHAFAGKIEQQQGGQLIAAFPGKIFDHFSEVVDLLAPILSPLGYKFYQIGAGNEPSLKGAECLCGKTTVAQCAYLVKNAAIFVGNDSMWAHCRGAAMKPMIELFGTTDRKNHGPEWFNPDCSVFLESHRTGKKPSYAMMESPKTVNWIPVELVANSVLRLLGLPELIERKSLAIGPEYHNVGYEIVPNNSVNPQINIGIPVIRMDYRFNEDVLAQNLSFRKCAIITDREFNLNIVTQFKSQINAIRVEVDKIDPNWLKTLKKIGLPVQFVSREKDPEKLAALRLKLYDVCLFDQLIFPTREDVKRDIEAHLNKSLDPDFNFGKMRFKSNHFLIANGKTYLSKAHWDKDIPIESTEKNEGDVINEDEFWEDKNSHYYFTP